MPHITILIATISRKDLLEIKLPSCSTIAQLKAKISEFKEVQESRVRLIFSGKFLNNDDASLQEVGLRDKSRIVLMIKKPKFQDNDASQISKEREVEKSCVDSDSESDGDEELSDIQVYKLYHVLNNDPCIGEILAICPQLREELKNPNILLQALSILNHPVTHNFDTFKSNKPTMVYLTQREKKDFDMIKKSIIFIVGNIDDVDEGRLNSYIYQAYTITNRDISLTANFVAKEILDGNLL